VVVCYRDRWVVYSSRLYCVASDSCLLASTAGRRRAGQIGSVDVISRLLADMMSRKRRRQRALRDQCGEKQEVVGTLPQSVTLM
jgi:hypothetical protein